MTCFACISVIVTQSDFTTSGVPEYSFILPPGTDFTIDIDEPSQVPTISFKINNLNPDDTPSVTVNVILNPGTDTEKTYTKVGGYINLSYFLF